jgi:filamentous hemagglutinin
MNKNLHRIIFNAARGTRMAVQETARSPGKAQSSTAAGTFAAALAALMGMPLAHAQIVASPLAPGSQRPTVLAAPNGVPLVNIQTPSAAGVSRNTYSQFDIQAGGAILNNSRTSAQTQLGGWVPGNPWMTRGTARVIVNEIVSGNPTQLRGALEVAGQRAEVIVANPTGIRVDGGSFINASRATLTTGQPQWNPLGGLDGYLVRGGTVRIDGKGLDLGATDYAAIYARAMEVNAGIWANDLRVVTGANRIDAQHGDTTPVAGSGAAPAFSLDVAALGGMYAGKIVLVGNEAGLGMRNAGTIQATPGSGPLGGAGELVVTAAGRLENTGTLEAQRLQLASTGDDIVNRGTIAQRGTQAFVLDAPVLRNTGGGSIGRDTAPAAEAPSAGSEQGSAAAPGPSTPPDSPSDPGALAPTEAPASAPIVHAPGILSAAGVLHNDGGRILAAGETTLRSPRVDNSGGTLNLDRLDVSGERFGNAGGTLAIAGDFNATVGRFDNAGGTLHAGRIAIDAAGDLDNIGGTLASAGELRIAAGGLLDNRGGTLAAKGHVSVAAGSLQSNSTSTMAAGTRLENEAPATEGDLRVITRGALVAQGLNSAAGNIQLSGAGIDVAGSRSRASNIRFVTDAGDIVTQGAEVEASGELTIRAHAAPAQTLDNQGGLLQADRIEIQTGDLLNGQGRILQSGTSDTRITVGRIDNSQGQIATAGHLELHGTTLDNGGGTVQSLGGHADLSLSQDLNNADGLLGAAADLRIVAANLTNGAHGTAYAGADTHIALTGALDNAGAIAAAGDTHILADRLASRGLLAAGLDAEGQLADHGDLDIETRSSLVATGTNLAAGRMTLRGGELDLSGSQTSGASIELRASQGGIRTRDADVTTAGTLHVNTPWTFDNQGGRVAAALLDVDAGHLANTGGQIVQTGDGAGALRVAGHLDNSGGGIASNGVSLGLIAQDLSNEGGTIEHAGSGVLHIQAGTVRGDDGTITGNGEVSLSAGDIQHRNAQLSAAQVTIGAASLDNAGGRITQGGSGPTRVSVDGEMRNDGGLLQSNGDTTLTVGSLVNHGGLIAATGTTGLSLSASGAIDNSGGTLSGGGATRIDAASLDNGRGLLSSGGGLIAHVQGLLANGSGWIAANRSAHVSAGTLANADGELTAGDDLALQVQGAIGNQNGLITANGNASVRGAGLDNAGGQLGAGANLDLQVAGALSNQGGRIVANGSAAIDAGSLDNQAGSIGAVGGDLGLDIAGHANSTNGRLQAGGRLDLAVSGLTNTGGIASGSGGVHVDTRGGQLDNSGGKLLSGGDIDIASGEIGNAGGQIAADGAIRIDSAALDNSAGGRIDGLGEVTIDTQGHPLTNDGGRILAQESLRLTAAAAHLSNVGGLIRGQGDLIITAGSVDNSGTAGDDHGIEARQTLQLTADTLDNQGGAIRAIGDATVTVAQANNAGGLVFSGGTLKLADATGGNLHLDNTRGQIIGAGGVDLGIGESSGPGTVSSGGDVNLHGAGDWTNSEVVESGGNITYDFAGMLTNNGTLSAGETLVAKGHDVINNAGAVMTGQRVEVTAQGTLTNHGTLDAVDTLIARGAGIVNGASGLITAGGHTYLRADGSLTNDGTIDGEDTQVRGDRITNTSRIYGTWLSVGGGASAVNEAGGVIAARSYLDLGADAITNRGELLSEGGMSIAGALDDSGIAVGKASVLRNESALISANGSMTLAAADIQNIDTHLSVERTSTQQPTRTIITVAGVVLPEGTEAMPAGAPGTPGARYLLVKQADGTWIPMGPGYSIQTVSLTVEEDHARNAQAAHILAGGDIEVDGRLTNRDSQVLAGGAYSANVPGINEPTLGTRREYGASDLLIIGINPNQSGDHRFTTPIDNTDTVDLTPWGAPRGGGGSVSNNVPGGSAGGGTPGGGNGPNGPNIGPGGGGGAGGGNVIVEVPSAVGGAPGVSAVSGASAGRSSQRLGPDGAPLSVDDTRLPDASGPLVVRTATPNLQLPGSSLFNLRPDAGGYLVETDPRYANYREWASSERLLDPGNLQKRLGDGYYEQRLIREQVALLTGSRYLEGFNSDEAQYVALMNAGATFAQQYNLTPGIALTAQQMAQLTSDIVWLVSQSVTLPDGSTQSVLVPQLYVRVRPGDIDGRGTLLSADTVRIKGAEGAGDLVNRGTIAGRTLVDINADNIRNLDGGRVTGGSVQLKAHQDIDNIGSNIDARQSLKLDAGRDVNVTTTTTSRQSAFAEHATTVERVAGLYVTGAGGTLEVDAKRDINLTGATIVNRDSANPASASGLTRLDAGRDLNLATVTESQSRADAMAGGHSASSSSREIGTTITTNGFTSLTAGQDINARQATVDAGRGLLLANAGRNLNIVDGQATSSSDYAYQTTKKGTFSSTTTSIAASQESSSSVGSIFKGGLVSLHADNNVNIVGSHISGTQGVGITAGNRVNIVEGRDTSRSSASFNREKSSSLPNPSPTFNRKQSVGNATESGFDNAAASTVTSSQGGVLIEGGGSVLLRGVQIDAANDVNIKGGDVTIVAATNEAFLSQNQRNSSRANTLSVFHGLNAKSDITNEAQVTTLARSTISGENVNITATGENGTSGALTIGGTTINAPGKLKLEGDSLNLALQSTEATTSQTGGRSNLTWQSTKDSGTADETLHYNQLNVGQLQVNANRVTVGMNAKDSVEALSQQPGMGWVQQINSDPNLAGKVDWQKVEEAHRNWDYGKSGLTPEGAAVVTAIVTWATWGTASGLGASAGSAAGGGTTGLVVSGAVTAGVSALAGQASVALINSQGDIGAALHDLGSSSSVKNLLAAIVTGGVLGGLNMNPTGLPTVGGGAQPFMEQLGQNLTAGAAKAVISTAINGGSLESALSQGLKNAILDTIAAQGAFGIGSNIEPGSVANMLAHAIAGCAVGAARTNGSCSAGALGAAIGELAASLYDPGALNTRGDTAQFAAMISSIAGAVAGLDAAGINLASQAGANAAANNWLATQQKAQFEAEKAAAKTPLDQLKVLAKWGAASFAQDELTKMGVGVGLVQSGVSDVKGLLDFLSDPVAGLNGLRLLVTDLNARQQLGDSLFGELDAKITRIQTALDVGGAQNAVQLGQDLGSLIYQVGTVVTGAGAAAKGGVALVNAAANVGTKVLEGAALQFMKLDAGVIQGFKSAEEVNAMMKAAPSWSPAWQPGTTVAEVTMKPGTTVHMVVDKATYDTLNTPGASTSRAFGGWATFDDVPNVAYARNQLAITFDMKPSTDLYVVEVQINKPINAQVGVVGAQGTASGGGNQLHFFLPAGERANVFTYVAGSGRAL